MTRWRAVRSIDVELVISRALMERKGFPERLVTSVAVDVDRPRTIMRPYGGVDGYGAFTAESVRIVTVGGTVEQELHAPRDSFAGHTRETPWDQLHRLEARDVPSTRRS